MTERARAMAARLGQTAERLGIDAGGKDCIGTAFGAALAIREAAGVDEDDPDHLHPARTALVLMDDAGLDVAPAIAAAILTETRDRALRPDPGTVAGLGAEVVRLVAAVPDPAEAETLLERLVSAEPRVLLIALAERLDHARHLHLRPRSEWEAYHKVTCAVYAQAATRAHPLLQRRFDWWCRTFNRRFAAAG